MSESRVGIIGTGAMGRPVVARLLDAGHRVSAYVRRPEARQELASAGVDVLSEVADLGSCCDFVLIYLYSDQQVRDVVLGGGLLESLDSGSIVVIHTTGSPTTAQSIASTGVAVVDAPGSGGPAQAADGTLTLFAGGEVGDVERCQRVFAAYAANVVHFGPVGAGQTVKLLNNLLFGAHTQLALEAARVAELFDIDVPELVRTLHHCSGASYAIDLVAAMGSADELMRAAGPFIAKDVRVARQVAADIGVPLGLLDLATSPLLSS